MVAITSKLTAFTYRVLEQRSFIAIDGFKVYSYKIRSSSSVTHLGYTGNQHALIEQATQYITGTIVPFYISTVYNNKNLTEQDLAVYAEHITFIVKEIKNWLHKEDELNFFLICIHWFTRVTESNYELYLQVYTWYTFIRSMKKNSFLIVEDHSKGFNQFLKRSYKALNIPNSFVESLPIRPHF
jgi:hypothetical protein